MSMVRGKLEALREVSSQNMVIGDAFIFERDGEWFDSSKPNIKANVEIIKFDDLNQNYSPIVPAKQSNNKNKKRK